MHEIEMVLVNQWDAAGQWGCWDANHAIPSMPHALASSPTRRVMAVS